VNKRKKIKQDFRNLLEIIEQQRPGYIAAMGEGVSDEIIRDCIKIHPIPEELMAIYSCVRGSSSSVMYVGDSDYPIDLLPGSNLINIYELDKVINFFKTINRNPESWGWQLDMIPFLEHCEVDYYCVRTLPDDQSVVFCPKGDRWITISQNIEDFILLITECYKQNAYFLDDIFLESNYNLEEQIILKFNPNYYAQYDLEP